MRFPKLLIYSVLLSTSFAAQGKMFKWVDEEGQMHFGDKIPPKYMVKEHEELNEQGVVTKHKKAAKTSKQKAEDRRREEEQRKIALEEKRKQQRDRVLLDTYTTERDLKVARDSRLDAVDSQIQLSQSIIDDSEKKLKSMEKRVVDIQGSGREVPEDLYKRIKNEKKQISVQQKVKKNHQVRRDEISAQFNDYIERFKVLKAEQKARREKIARERGY